VKKKLPSDKVTIDLTKEDLQLKRKIVKHLKETNADQNEQLKLLMTETVGTLNCIHYSNYDECKLINDLEMIDWHVELPETNDVNAIYIRLFLF
jgi:hypothetical protein